MRKRVVGLIAAMAIAALATAPLLARTSNLSGVVTDAGGGVLPGVTVVVKNNATGTTFDVVTNTEGVFSVPGDQRRAPTPSPSSLTGFKTAVINDVRVAPGTPATVKAVLEVGQLDRDGHRREQLRADQHADGDGRRRRSTPTSSTACRRRRATR